MEKSEALITPDWLVIGMNISMLGMIHKDIRLITAEFDEVQQIIFIKSYLDREVHEDDYEDLEILTVICPHFNGQLSDQNYVSEFKCYRSK